MKCNKKIWIIFIACFLAFGIFTWRYTRNGVHEKIGTSDLFYYKHGFIEKDRNGFVYSQGDWWYLRNGKVQTDINGLVYGEVSMDVSGVLNGELLPGELAFYNREKASAAGWWYVADGKVKCTDTLVKMNGSWWCVQKGRVNFSYNGIAENENGMFYVKNGRVYFNKNGAYMQDGCTYILENGEVQGELSVDSTRFVAHRGLNTEAPENTVKAFELAGEAGFWGCETDVRITADNRFVLLHNQNFERMCGQKIVPEDLTYDEIKQMRIVSGSNLELYQDDPSAVTIAFLEEFLDVCLTYDMVPVIDMKERSTQDAEADYERMRFLYETTNNIMGDHKVVFISFDFELLKLMREILREENAENVTLQYLTRDVTDPPFAEYQNWNIDLDADYEKIRENTITSFNESGIEVNIWTVDDAVMVYDLIQQGADYITTDRKFW